MAAGLPTPRNGTEQFLEALHSEMAALRAELRAFAVAVSADPAAALAEQLHDQAVAEPEPEPTAAFLVSDRKVLQRHTKAQLQAMAEDAGVPTSGTKAELVDRLLAAD